MNTSVNILKCSTWKHMYYSLLGKVVKEPSCKVNWESQYGIKNTDEEWEIIFNTPWTIGLSPKLIEFQYKIIHKTFASNSFVSR